MTETDLFEPQPGGVIDRAQSAEESAAPIVGIDYAVPVAVEDTYIVQTREQRGFHSSYFTVAIAAGTFQRILGRNDIRRSAVVSCISGSLFLCANSDLAQAVAAMALAGTPTVNVQGFYMTAGSPGSAIPVTSREGVYGVATTGGVAVVSVAQEWFAD